MVVQLVLALVVAVWFPLSWQGMRQALLIFVKNPVKGTVKTRLAATLGDEATLAIYQELLKHTANCTHSVLANKTVYYASAVETKDLWSNEIYEKATQTGADLGERMSNAFKKDFDKGYGSVAIIGSDCFEITAEIIDDAFRQLAEFDVVVGPASDGGYYLLALNAHHAELFTSIEWSTDKVFSQTLAVCQKLGLTTKKLQVLSDIDTESDLIRTNYSKFKSR